MPRKKAPEGEVRSTGIRVTLTQSEHEAVKDAAWQARQTVSDWARDLILKALSKVKK